MKVTKKSTKNERRQFVPTIAQIVESVCAHYDMPEADIYTMKKGQG